MMTMLFKNRPYFYLKKKTYFIIPLPLLRGDARIMNSKPHVFNLSFPCDFKDLCSDVTVVKQLSIDAFTFQHILSFLQNIHVSQLQLLHNCIT